MNPRLWAALSMLLLAANLAGSGARAVILDYEVVSDSSPSSSAGSQSVGVVCPPETQLLGGGASVSGFTAGTALVTSQALVDFGSGEPIGWTAEMREVVANPSNWSLRAYAVCGTVPGLERVGDETDSNSEQLKALQLACPPGKMPVSGGFEIGGANEGITVFQNVPVDGTQSEDLPGWKFGAVETNATSNNWSLRGQVLCADLDVLVLRTGTGSARAEQFRNATVYCPAGFTATGGGAELFGTIVDWIYTSRPNFSGESWRVQFQRPDGETASSSLDYYAVCPEPWAGAQGGLALASLLVIYRRRSRFRTRRPG